MTQGPLINEKAVEKVERLLKDAVAHGAKVTLGGKRSALGHTFFEPTIETGATPDMEIAREEIFGPVATLYRFKDEAEAHPSRQRHAVRPWRRISTPAISGVCCAYPRRCNTAIIGVNEGIISTEVAPFGGVKESGIGREGSKYGIEDYLSIKYVLAGGL